MKSLREKFINRTARIPHGKKAMGRYADPKAHYKSFEILLKALSLQPQDDYFEIGCGGGMLLQRALEICNSAAAIDHSSDMVKVSIEKNKAAIAQKRLEVVQGDAAALPWETGRFSVGASANMFFFVEDPQTTLNEAFRVLNSGGRFALITLGKNLFTRATFGWLYQLRLYSNDTMQSMLEKAGFEDIFVSTHKGFYQICHARKK